MPKTVFISGASSGIGYACAKVFAKQGFNLILTGRRADKLSLLKEEILKESACNIKLLIFDVQNRDEVFASIKKLSAEWQNIDVLINNAGLALGLSHFYDSDCDDWDRMIDTNLKGLLWLTRAIVPFMIEQKSGHIINIGSIAAKETYINGSVYCATKHAVDSLTKAMRMELLEHNIKVSLVNPGATETEFSLVRFKGDAQKAEAVYKGYAPLKAEDIAKCVEFCVSLPSHVNINDMLVMPSAQASAGVFYKNVSP